MRNSLFFCSILYYILTSFNLQAQSFAPVGTSWTYSYYGGCQPWCAGGQSEIKVIKDTVINSVNAKKIIQNDVRWLGSPPPQTNSTSLQGYLFERNDSIFFSPYNTLNYANYLYGFNMKIGDSYIVDYNMKITVDSIKYETINEIDKKVFYISKSYINGMDNFVQVRKIIEDIGPVDDYLLWNHEDAEYPDLYGFNCYSDGETNYPISCKTLAIKNKEEYSFSISPNPCTSELTITSEEVIEHFEIYNAYGVKLQSIFPGHLTETKVQLTLPSGPYIIMIYNQNRFGTKHFIVK